MSKNKAVTPTEKYINANCSKCEHYWLKLTYETCTEPKNNIYYNKKIKVGNMIPCDHYDPNH